MLQSEFGQTLGSPGVHIIDPFTGTGTFITRLLQSGLIAPEEMEHKFRHEIHANEIVLLAYYIAAINIEAVYHGLQGGDYVPFEGICLTDTFQMYESDDLISHYMPDNSERRKRQKATDIRVIVGNPPYSAGQGSANDNNANVAYPTLDGRIRDTYAARSTATLKNSLYDSYIRAFRWASDRIGDAGVMAYVSNAGWLDGNAADGIRACLAEEFSDLYIFHLRGNARTSGEQRRKERGNVFGEGTRTPVAISILVKNPDATAHGRVHFHDIGDYLDQKEKLAIIRDFESVRGISSINGWVNVQPDAHNDWLGQRDSSFDAFIKIGDKRDRLAPVLFENYTSGLKTNRDTWCCNFQSSTVLTNMKATIDFYNSEVTRYQSAPKVDDIKDFVDKSPPKISWDHAQYVGVERGKYVTMKPASVVPSMYRPFARQWAYFDRDFNNRVYQIPSIFPDAKTSNRVIAMCGVGGKGFSVLMSSTMPDIQMMFNGQCFPLSLYGIEENEDSDDLFSEAQVHQGRQKRDAITDVGLKHFQDAYPGEIITKEDLFYYVYGLLHSEDYRAKYADNLSKELPRIPRVKTAADFWAFSRAGRTLGDLHVNYETVEPYPVTMKQGDLRLADIKNPEAFYRVTKWAFGKSGKDKDKTTVIYNANITMQDVPLGAYDYVVNGKPALEWVMERQVVKTDKDSGIENDANRYAIETMNNPAYPLELFQRVINVSLRTMEIVRGLPKLEVM
ncbi:type ISP restriction/modification enzyme [Cypionkella psychrotolerans]|uniref:type ISP restriction/modification enzyme n=1 Tax=Cypionkella psychrotolerans TaxID=1678131 RepID=UPI001F214B27|nr:type ISP restriction/modification enzyme [Cypionkella psychrotolerans]